MLLHILVLQKENECKRHLVEYIFHDILSLDYKNSEDAFWTIYSPCCFSNWEQHVA